MGTQFQSLIWEDPSCRRAKKCVHHNCWACTLEPGNHNYWAHLSQLPKPAHSRACAPQQEKPLQWEAHTMQLENSSQSPQTEKSLCIDEDTVWFRCLVLSNSLWPHCSTPGFPVHHQLPELPQTHVHRVSDAIQPSRPLLSPSPPAFNLSQHQGLFQRVNSSHQVAKVLEFQLQHQSFQWIFRNDFL